MVLGPDSYADHRPVIDLTDPAAPAIDLTEPSGTDVAAHAGDPVVS